MYAQFIHPFTIMVCGPSSCGKTTFVLKLLDSLPNVCNISKFCHVVWCHGGGTIPKCPQITRVHEGVPEVEDMDGQPQLYIIDDLMHEAGHSGKVLDLFTKYSHHKNISVILISQNIFHRGPFIRDISLNAKYLVMFKNPRDRSQSGYVFREMYPQNSRVVQTIYNEATAPPHGYLFIDLCQNTNESLRLKTDIFNPQYITIYTDRDETCEVSLPVASKITKSRSKAPKRLN